MSDIEIKELVDAFRLLKQWREDRETLLLASGEEQAIAVGAGVH